MKVRDLVSVGVGEVVTISSEATLGEAAEVMKSSDVSGLPVVDEAERLVGIVTMATVLRSAQEGLDDVPPPLLDPTWRSDVRPKLSPTTWKSFLVRDAMVKDVVCVDPEDDVREAARRMLEAGVHRVVVASGKGRHPVGMISALDFVRLVRDGDARG